MRRKSSLTGRQHDGSGSGQGALATMQELEPRRMLSAGVPAPALAPVEHVAAAVHPMRAGRVKNCLISFYGQGGTGFPNDWVSKLAGDTGRANGYFVSKYKETQGDDALADFLKGIDVNRDKIIQPNEINAMTVRVVGYSYGAIQGSNFTRSLTSTRRSVEGYKLMAAIPVTTFVAIDPVNYTGVKYTGGPLGNVRKFVCYYEDNLFNGTITLLDHATHQELGTRSYGTIINPIGFPLSTSAQQSTQTAVDQGDWASKTVIHPLDSDTDGEMTGSDVNHTTMPFFVYSFAMVDLAG